MNSLAEEGHIHNTWRDAEYKSTVASKPEFAINDATDAEYMRPASNRPKGSGPSRNKYGGNRRPLNDVPSSTSEDASRLTLSLAKSDPAKYISTLIKTHPYLMVGKSTCPYTRAAKQLLNLPSHKGVPSVSPYIVDIDLLPNTVALQAELKSQTGHRTFPNILVEGHEMGGFDDIKAIVDSSEDDNELLRRLRMAGVISDPADPNTAEAIQELEKEAEEEENAITNSMHSLLHDEGEIEGGAAVADDSDLSLIGTEESADNDADEAHQIMEGDETATNDPDVPVFSEVETKNEQNDRLSEIVDSGDVEA